MTICKLKEVKQLYGKEKERFKKEGHILAIQECSGEDFLLTCEERLKKYGFGDYAMVGLGTDTVDVSPLANSGEQYTAGRAVPVKRLGGFHTIIFLRERFDDCPSELIHWVVKLGVLFHELGHAWDFKTGLHTDLETGVSDAEKAEEYADKFAKKRLSRIACDFDSNAGMLTNLWECYDRFRHRGIFQKSTDDLGAVDTAK